MTLCLTLLLNAFFGYLQDTELRNRKAILELDMNLNIFTTMLLFLEVKEMAMTECLCPWRKRDAPETRGQD